MTLPKAVLAEFELAKIRRYAAARVPARAAAQVRMEVDVQGRSVTIVECRPPWRANYGPDWTRLPIARLRFEAKSALWTLYWRDSNQNWHRYDRSAPAPHVDPLLAEIEADPTAIFWG